MDEGVKEIRSALKRLGILDKLPKEHIEDTPERIWEVWKEFTENIGKTVEVKTFPSNGYHEMIICKNINFNSLCIHHFLPFSGVCHVAYIPQEEIIGLSKIPRIVKFFAKQPQYQEKLVGEIADFFMQKVKPQGCMVIMEARHQCMACRGVESTGELITSAVRGSFLKDVNLKNEALRLLGVKE